jgi:hypothetical protein
LPGSGMSRQWHLRQAHAARRGANRQLAHQETTEDWRDAYWFWRGKEDAHLETCTAIDRSTKRAQKSAKRVRKAA